MYHYLTSHKRANLLDIYGTPYSSKPRNFRLQQMSFPGITQISVNGKLRNYYQLDVEDTNIKSISINSIGSFTLNDQNTTFKLSKPYYTVHLKLKYNHENYKEVSIDCKLESNSITINAEDAHLTITKQSNNALHIQCFCCGWYSIYIEDIIGYNKETVSNGTRLTNDITLVTENHFAEAIDYFTDQTVYTGTGSDRVFHANKYWYIQNVDYGTVKYSEDGIHWYSASSMNFFNILNIHYANGIYVLAADEEGLWYSTDGLNWTQSNISYVSRPGNFTQAIRHWIYYDYTEGLWVSMGYYSTDGKTWTQCKKSDGNTFTFQGAYHANDIWVAWGNARLYYSLDGKTGWVEVQETNPGKNYLFAVHYANGVWVAASEDSTSTNTQSYEGIYYSTNGKTWTQVISSVRGFVDVYFGNGVWVAASSSGLYYSIDNARTWTKSSYGSSYGVFYENGLWIASGGDLISTDGKNWSVQYLGAGGRKDNVYACNNVWALGSALGVNVVKLHPVTELEFYTKVQI